MLKYTGFFKILKKMNLEKLKFPIGKYQPNKFPNQNLVQQWIKTIEDFPSEVKQITQNISKEQRNYLYRPNGWNVKQVIHHCADSHMNSFIRFKLALTEENPTIRPYFEEKWAEIIDGINDDITLSINLLESLHSKWVYLLKNLTEAQLQRKYTHPEHGTVFNLYETIGSYAWHCEHHLAHIKNGIASNGIYNS